jgi:hypothetical protein
MPRSGPIGILLIAFFFAVATLILIAVGVALMFPGGAFERVWMLYPARRALLMPYRMFLGPGFLALAVVFAAASTGCFLRRRWGWGLAVAIFAANGLGDALQLATGHFLEGGIGVVAAAAILYYLTRAFVRHAFLPRR